MYRILLADDEGIVIDSLKFIIEKEFGNECEIASAKTGRSVIELAEAFRPDIAVMDIQMPGINGIEAMREIRKTNASVVFIVMSAYDKFDYAQEAIKLGVLDYITKPMDRNRMITVLRKAMDFVSSEREKRSNDLIIKEKLETIVPILESGLIYDILFQEHFDEDIENYKTLLELDADYAYMMNIVCGDTREGNHMTNAVGSSVRLVQYYKDIRQNLKSFTGCIVGSLMANKIPVMVPYGMPAMDYGERTELIDRTRELVRSLRKKYDVDFRIGIGSVHKLTDMASSYTEAVNALVMTSGSVAHADDLPIGCDYTPDYPIDLEKRLFEAVSHGKLDDAVENARDYFKWMCDKDTNDVRLKVIEFVLWAERLAYENGGMTYRFESRRDYFPVVAAAKDMSTLEDWFVNKIGDACRNIMNKRTERSMSVVETAKEYIRNNFSRNISLEDASMAVNISPYYFSRIFKEETGENFIDYLTELRIEKAKDLLSNSTYSVKEICSMVGYSDPNYFSRSFKKNVGVTPTEFKDNK